jgi:hypothetical protein
MPTFCVNGAEPGSSGARIRTTPFTWLSNIQSLV